MRALPALLLCGAALAQERAFVEVTAPKEEYYAGERILLTLRFGFDREFFGTSAVPLFPQPVDVPVHVQVRLPPVEAPSRPPRGPTFALNDDIAEGVPAPDETRDGRVFAVLEWRRFLSRPEPGELAIPAPTLRYAYATRFEEDFVLGRVGRDPRDVTVEGRPLALRVLPLPAEGRPKGFDGAVGRFTIEAECRQATVREGERFRVTVTIRGDGAATLRRLDLPGFHVYGIVYGDDGKTAACDIAALSADVKEIPAIAFAFFDPGPPATYRVVSTEPIPLEVRAVAKDPAPPPPARPEEPFPTAAVVIAALAIVAVVALLLLRRRAPEAPPDPHAVRVRDALALLRDRPGADALADFLAVYLGCPPAAVIGPDLAARLAAEGLPQDLAGRIAAALERLVAARYGGGGGGEDLRALVAEIEASLSGGSPT